MKATIINFLKGVNAFQVFTDEELGAIAEQLEVKDFILAHASFKKVKKVMPCTSSWRVPFTFQ